MNKLKFILFITCFKCIYLYSYNNRLFPTIQLTNSINQNTKDSSVLKKYIQLSIKHDTLNNQTIMFLSINDSLVDSTIIEKVSFDYNVFTKVNDTLWRYIYSKHLYKGSPVVRKEVLIGESNKKIHFYYVNDYMYHSQTTKFEEIGDHDHTREYKLWLTDSLFGSFVEVIIKRRVINELGTQIDSVYKIYYLDYDTKNKVFYNSLDTLNGIYGYTTIKPIDYKYTIENLRKDFRYVKLENEVVKKLDLEEPSGDSVFYKGKWFIIKENEFYGEVESEYGGHIKGDIYPFQNIVEDWLPIKK